MLSIAWDAPLTNKALGHPEMDETHEEFVRHVHQVQQAVRARDARAVERCFEELVAHTEGHFSQEEAWMRATRCTTAAEHARQHQSVLALLHRARGLSREEACWGAMEAIVRELKGWFMEHEQLLDADLVLHLEEFFRGRAPKATEARAGSAKGPGTR